MRHGWLILALVLVVLTVFASPVFAEEAGAKHEEGSNIFKGFVDLSIWTIVVFLVLFFVLAKFAWKPMLAGLKEREDSIHGAMEEAKAAKEEAAKLTELQAEIAKARAEGQTVRDEARRDAERLREEIMGKAKAEMQAERERLRTDMETARDQVLAELWRRRPSFRP